MNQFRVGKNLEGPQIHRKGDSPPHKTWAIILAGGEGERLRPLTEKWLGYHCPKQFCTFVGQRSMLEHTLDRALKVVNSKRILTVTSERHNGWLDPIESKLPGKVISQPGNHGTAPGIFLPASYILENDPSATTLIFPCDHFVFPENRFNSYIKRITEIAEEVEDRMVLVGVKPTRPETDYGWIEPGLACSQTAENPAMRVKSFREKPNQAEAGRYLRLGYLWNTMIIAVKVKTLWKLGQRLFPRMMVYLEALTNRRSRRSSDRERILDELYTKLGLIDFSRDLLQKSPEDSVVVPMDDVEWDDWGRPDRIVRSLSKHGLKPAFPVKKQDGLKT